MPVATDVSGPTVFINCPFDDQYRQLFHIIVFTVMRSGFVPSSALQIVDSGQIRLSKIFDLIRSSAMGIHDISRTELDEEHQLPRFNMPLELGIFLGAKEFGGKRMGGKPCLILDTKKFRYQKFISDIAGQDPSVHENDPQKLVRCVRNFLNIGAQPLPSASALYTKFVDFETCKAAICEEFELDPNDLDFRSLCFVISGYLAATATTP